MALDLYAVIPVSGYTAALEWYEKLFGKPADFHAGDDEAVWDLAEHRSVAVAHRPEHAGHGLLTIFVDDYDERLSQLAARGLEPAKQEVYDNGIRHCTFHDPEGNEISFGTAPEA